jgi:hypothetical protein
MWHHVTNHLIISNDKGSNSENRIKLRVRDTRVSIKALQVLGNTIRGLSMANWRLVLNAVCLPVLTYGSQLWFLTGAAKGLTNMVQRVQNDMVRQVTGAFRTAPHEPLLHFTRMLPMKFFIEKLTYTSALRLYRLPRESQILRRLSTDWYSPGQGDLPLPVPHSRVLPGKRNQRPTALEALALKVPSGGPKVDVVALAPWEVPNWVKHVSYMGVENPCVRKNWIRDLTGTVKDSNTMLVHLAAATLNREAEGLGVVGGAAATYSRGGAEITSHDWVIGTDVTVSPSPQSQIEEEEKLHALRKYARDFRRQHTTDAEWFNWDSDDEDYGLAIGRLVIT